MNIFICDNCAEQAAICENKLMQLAQQHDIRLKTRVFPTGDALLFEAEPILGNIDLIYLDIQMPGSNGLQTASKLRKMDFQGDIVFYTFNADHAIDGYDVSALHYVIKDIISDKKFEEIFWRAFHRKQRREQEMLVLTCAGESRCIPLQDIIYFEVNQRIVTVHYTKGSFEFYSTMMRMEEQLFGKGFVRSHKSFLVNMRWIRAVDSNKVTLDTEESLPVGKKYYSDNLRDLGVINKAPKTDNADNSDDFA